MTRSYLLRVTLVALTAWFFFSYLCIPIRIQGGSMEPAYRDGGWNFIWGPAYLFSAPERGDVVAVRFAGKKVMLLKRVVAVEGETVEFSEGILLINGNKTYEPYVHYGGNWILPLRTVEKGNVYVVGDNRSVPMKHHTFGQTSMKRIIGAPLF